MCPLHRLDAVALEGCSTLFGEICLHAAAGGMIRTCFFAVSSLLIDAKLDGESVTELACRWPFDVDTSTRIQNGISSGVVQYGHVHDVSCLNSHPSPAFRSRRSAATGGVRSQCATTIKHKKPRCDTRLSWIVCISTGSQAVPRAHHESCQSLATVC